MDTPHIFKYTLLGLLLALQLDTAVAAERPKILFSCSIPANLELFKLIDGIYRRAFDAIGYDFAMVYRPSKRALTSAVEGYTDGDCARIYDIEQNIGAGKLIRVEIPLVTSELSIWTYNPSLKGMSFQELIDKPYIVGYVRGSLIMEEALKHRDAKLTYALNDYDQALKMLNNQRLDLFIGHESLVAAGSEILPAAPLRAGRASSYSVYPYLNPRNAKLAKPLAGALARELSDHKQPLYQLPGLSPPR